MCDLTEIIPRIRNSVCAVMRIHPLPPTKAKKNKPSQERFQASIAGTAWCFKENKYLLTANHIFNGGQARDPNDKFFAFVVPNNGDTAYHAPVIDFPFADSSVDLSIIEVDPSKSSGFSVQAVPITFNEVPDGTRVLTYGFPAPEVVKVDLDQDKNWRGGTLFLKGHANEGIVASQYDLAGARVFEFNVAWHHGESGGPLFTCSPVAAFAIMQQYRNVKTPFTTIPGPHLGRALKAIERDIRDLGAIIV